MGLYNSLCVLRGLYGSVLVLLFLFASLWILIGSLWVLLSHYLGLFIRVGTYNSLHLLMRPYGLAWDPINRYKAFCVLIGPY